MCAWFFSCVGASLRLRPAPRYTSPVISPIEHQQLGPEAAARVTAEVLEAGGAAGALDRAFAWFDALSHEAYERSENRAALLVCPRERPRAEVLLELLEPVPLGESRAARKLLQMSDAGLAPLADGGVIWGLGRPSASVAARADLVEVRFAGRGRWELRRGDRVIFVVENGRPMLPRAPLDRDRLEAGLRRAFPACAAGDVARVWSAVSSVIATGCGITVVVSSDAAHEARRLASQGTPIRAGVLEPEVLQAATGIGGAMLLDPTGVCHAIGVILDGIATPHGRPSRGSRFNSAVNYVSNRPRTIAVVVSDDGSVDVLP